MSQGSSEASNSVGTRIESLKRSNDTSPRNMLPIMSIRPRLKNLNDYPNNIYNNRKSSTTEVLIPKKRILVENSEGDTIIPSAKRINIPQEEYQYPEEQNKLLSLLKSRMKIAKPTSPKKPLQNKPNNEILNTTTKQQDKLPNNIVSTTTINSHSIQNKPQHISIPNTTATTTYSITSSNKTNKLNQHTINTGNNDQLPNRSSFLGSMRTFLNRSYRSQCPTTPTDKNTTNLTNEKGLHSTDNLPTLDNDNKRANETDILLDQSTTRQNELEKSNSILNNSTSTVSQTKNDTPVLSSQGNNISDKTDRSTERSNMRILSQKPIMVNLENEGSFDNDGDKNIEKPQDNIDLPKEKPLTSNQLQKSQIPNKTTKTTPELTDAQPNTTSQPTSSSDLSETTPDTLSTLNKVTKVVIEEKNSESNKSPSSGNISPVAQTDSYLYTQKSRNDNDLEDSLSNSTQNSLSQSINTIQNTSITKKRGTGIQKGPTIEDPLSGMKIASLLSNTDKSKDTTEDNKSSQEQRNIKDKSSTNVDDPSILNTQNVKSTPLQNEGVSSPDIKRQKVTESSENIKEKGDLHNDISNSLTTGSSTVVMTNANNDTTSHSDPSLLANLMQKSPTPVLAQIISPKVSSTDSSLQQDGASNNNQTSLPEENNIVKQEELMRSLKDGVVQNDFVSFLGRLNTPDKQNNSPPRHSATLEVIYISDFDSDEPVEGKSSSSESNEESDLDGNATSVSNENQKITPQNVIERNTKYIKVDIPSEEIDLERKRYDNMLNINGMKTLNASKSHHRDDIVTLIESGIIEHTSFESNNFVSSTNNVCQSENFETSQVVDYQQLHKRDRLREIPLARVLSQDFINRGANLIAEDKRAVEKEKKITKGIDNNVFKKFAKKNENKWTETAITKIAELLINDVVKSKQKSVKNIPKVSEEHKPKTNINITNRSTENNIERNDAISQEPQESNSKTDDNVSKLQNDMMTINKKQTEKSLKLSSEKDEETITSSRELWRKEWIENLKLCYIYPYEAYPSNILTANEKKGLDYSFGLVKRILKERYNVPLLTNFDPKVHIVILKGDIHDFKGDKKLEEIQNTVQIGSIDRKVRVWSLNKVTKFLQNMDTIPENDHNNKPEADDQHPLLDNKEPDNSKTTQVLASINNVDKSQTGEQGQNKPVRDPKSSNINEAINVENKSDEDKQADRSVKKAIHIETTSTKTGSVIVQKLDLDPKNQLNTLSQDNSVTYNEFSNVQKNNIVISQPDTNIATVDIDRYEEQQDGLTITKMMTNLEELLTKVSSELQKERDENKKMQGCLFELSNQLLKQEMANSSLHACLDIEQKEKEIVEKERDYLKESLKKINVEFTLFKDIAAKRPKEAENQANKSTQ
ncbi:similar to Saccharomyces cerevisiae YDR227W SIR4 Silent information regulator that [Maudiozyma saulgeensis]|uniref:Similar to Saccharomyces cerevisiae YDR227W SIR4 Silent information regulator that n=1 Tax=Maudiozyma saulgeensis TaxID=1789683 RepID=A0A1X7R5P9_9SACH|nr:similar to Saccharomyces cerevisiae YDR227W SIR4 Silent information regulator that [Kazachstania saulgeensis]